MTYQLENGLDNVRQVRLYDAYGKLVKVTNHNDGRLSLAGLDAGMYLLVVDTDSAQFRTIVLKQ